MDGLVVRSHTCLLEGLGKSGMRVASSSDILGRGTVLEGENGLGDHFTGVSTNDPGSEYLICLLAGENLHKTLNILVAARSTISIKREGTLIILDALLNELLLAEADVGDLRVSVDDTRNSIVVDMTAFSEQMLNGCDTLFLGFMRKHRTVDDVTNSIDMRMLGLPRLVNFNLAILVSLEACLLQVKTASERPSTDGQKHNISSHLLITLCA